MTVQVIFSDEISDHLHECQSVLTAGLHYTRENQKVKAKYV